MSKNCSLATKRIKPIAAAILVVTLLSSSAFAAGKGPDLYDACVTAEKGSERDALCTMYVYGIAAGIWIAQTMYTAGQEFCLPKDEMLDHRQARAIVEKFMRDHPEKLNAAAPLVVAGALTQAFPCNGAK